MFNIILSTMFWLTGLLWAINSLIKQTEDQPELAAYYMITAVLFGILGKMHERKPHEQ